MIHAKSLRGLAFRAIAATIFLLVSISAPEAQSAAAADEQIKQNIIERLEQKINQLKQILDSERDVRVALAASDHLSYRDVLKRYDRQGNTYATTALDLIETESKSLAGTLNGTTYAHFPMCLAGVIKSKTDKSADIVKIAKDEIAKSPLKEASGALKTMLESFDTGQADKKLLSDCLRPPPPRPGPVAPKMVQSEPLNVKWSSRCLLSEQLNPDGTTPLTSPTVASLLYNDGIRGPTAFCTGTLIAPNIVLTAAHCFCQTSAKQPGGRFLQTARECSQGFFSRRGQAQAALDPRHHSVYFQHAGIFAIKQVILHPGFFWIGGLPNADVALLVLEKPVLDIAPTPINTIARLPPGREAKAVGYGFFRPIRADGSPADAFEIKPETGLKLQATIITDVCPASASRRGMICWTHKRRAHGLSLGSTCMGDSGGPLFAEHQGQIFLVGITTAGGVNCNPGSRAYDTEIFHFREWISESLRRHAFVPRAGQTPAIADQNKCMLCAFCSSTRHQLFSDGEKNISIGSAKTRRLRVSINCTPGPGRSPLSLTLARTEEKEPPPCNNETEPATVTSCEVAVKQGQQWNVTVVGAHDRQCQIVATTFNN